MKRTTYIVILLALGIQAVFAQKTSRADQAYFEYDYKTAIEEYLEESRKAPLSPRQQRNLAESYFRERQYKQAADHYVQLYREDSIMDNHHFNTMLQALSRTSEKDRVQAFLKTRTPQLSGELMENAAFNAELLESPGAGALDLEIFRLNGNSAQADYSPAFYGPDRLLFSSSRPQKGKDTYFPTGEAYMDIFVAPLQSDGQIGPPTPLNSLPALPFHEATPFHSEALQGIFYVRSNSEDGELTFDPNGKNSLTIVLTRRNGVLETLLRDPSVSFYYPFYQEATGRLYFAADFQQGYGGTDLYYVVTNQGQIMSAPVNLGPRINTPGNEISPFLIDGTLYFSSDVFYGLGGMDVYKSDMQPDGTFSIPANLGPGLNTDQDEFGFVIRPASDGGYQGYFASNRPGGQGSDDLYGFRTGEKPGLRTLAVSGEVVNTQGRAVEGARVRLLGASDDILKETMSGDDGAFRIEIPWRSGTRLTIDKNRYTSAEIGSADPDSTFTGAPLEIMLKPVEEVLREVRDRRELIWDKYYFERGSTRLTEELRTGLEGPLQALKDFPELHIRIEAHTDSRGSAQNNLTLSTARAEAIRDYLVQSGIDAERIEGVRGLGESQLQNHCEDGVYCLEVLHRQNERYLLVVTNFEEL